MKISEKQLLFLMDILKGSLSVSDGGTIWSYDEKQRTKMYNQIFNQQDETAKSISDKESIKKGE